MNRQELEQRLETVVSTIRTSEMELKKLREDKKHRILLLHPADLKSTSSRIRELEDQVEDNKLARAALEKEIQEFKEKKEPEALKIRKRLAEEQLAKWKSTSDLSTQWLEQNSSRLSSHRRRERCWINWRK